MSEDKKHVPKPISYDDLEYANRNLQRALELKQAEMLHYFNLLKDRESKLDTLLLWTESIYKSGFTEERKKTYSKLRQMIGIDNALKRLNIASESMNPSTNGAITSKKNDDSEPSESD